MEWEMLLKKEKDDLRSVTEMFFNAGIRKYFYQCMLDYYERHVARIKERDGLFEGLCSSFKITFMEFECKNPDNEFVHDIRSTSLILSVCFPEFDQEHELLKCAWTEDSKQDYPVFSTYWWDIADYESRIEFMERVIARCNINS